MSASKKEIVRRCCQQIPWQALDLEPVRALIALAKAEDLDASGLAAKPAITGDVSSALLPPDQELTATLRAREALTFCGAALAQEIVAAYDDALSFEARVTDGQNVEKGGTLGILRGPTRTALSAERPLLNFLQRLSGIATLTRRYAAALSDSPTRLLDTRKTTPGYRCLEKYAVACGGGWNHRIGLFDRVMLKDNHLAAFGEDLQEATQAAVAESRRRFPELLVEMEVDRIEQIEAALAAAVDIILLDNFSLDALKTAVALIGDRAVTEISGNVTLDTLPHIKELGCDFVSTGALVHKSVWVDIGLDWQ